MKAKLVLGSGKQQGRVTELAKGIYLVGRSRACQIRPKNRSVSRKHCAIINRGKGLFVQDVGSKTGTYINDEKIAAKELVELADGDSLRVGRTQFTFRIQSISSERIFTSAVEHGQSAYIASTARLQGHASSALLLEEPRPAPQSDLGEDASMDPTGAEILKLLEDEEQEPNAANCDRNFHLNGNASNVDVDLEDSDSGVDFLAPASGESLQEEDAVPAYQLRQDWDVQGVHKWVASKPTAAKPATSFQSTANPQKKQTPFRVKSSSGLAAWLDGDAVQPIGMGLGVAIFALWMAWNAWRLWSFHG